MSLSPLVSVVVVTYNSSKYILQTLDSIYNQTNINIELIITDDASQDKTVEVCNKWLSEHKSRFVRVLILTVEKNTGISANCNRGIKYSNGKFIKIIAGDDIMHPECIDNNINNIGDADLMVSQLIRFCNDVYYPLKDNSKLFDSFCTLDSFKRSHFYARTSFFFNVPTLFYRASVFKKIGYYYEEERLLEDVPFLLKFFNSNLKVSYMPIVTVYYRQSGISNNTSIKFDKVLIDAFFKYRIKYLNKSSLIDNIIIYERKLYSWLIHNRTNKDWLLNKYYSRYNLLYLLCRKLSYSFRFL